MNEMKDMQGTQIRYDDETTTLGDRIEAARTQKNISRKELAERLGAKKSTIKKWENDQSEPRSNRLYMMAGILDCNVMWLLNGDGETPMNDKELSPDLKISSLKAELSDLQRDFDRLYARLDTIRSQL